MTNCIHEMCQDSDKGFCWHSLRVQGLRDDIKMYHKMSHKDDYYMIQAQKSHLELEQILEDYGE